MLFSSLFTVDRNVLILFMVSYVGCDVVFDEKDVAL